MDVGTANLLEMLTERVIELTNQGKLEEAMHSADAAVEKARSSNQGGTDDVLCLAATLEIRGDLLRQGGYLDDALEVYHEAYALIGGDERYAEMQARISASTGVIYDLAENDEEAIMCYEKAIEQYENIEPVNRLEIADICNNLGFIYRSLGDLDTAETLLLKGLEISHHELGQDNEKTATLCNNVGALYLKSGYDDQAKEMLTMALESRIKVLGKSHPDTAQSYANLALSEAQLGETELAKKHFQKAIGIYEKHVEKESQEYATVVENYSEFLRANKEEKACAALVKKAKKKLAKVMS